MIVIHPRPLPGEQTDLGLDFTDGIASTAKISAELETQLLEKGYVIEGDPGTRVPYQEAVGSPIVDLEKLTKAELIALLPEGTEVPSGEKHAEIVARVDALPKTPVLTIGSDPGVSSMAFLGGDDE